METAEVNAAVVPPVYLANRVHPSVGSFGEGAALSHRHARDVRKAGWERLPFLKLRRSFRTLVTIVLPCVLTLEACSGHALHLVAAHHESSSAELAVELTPYGVGVDLDGHSVHTLLVFKNTGRRPLAIVQRNIELVDEQGTVAIPVAKLSKGQVAGVRALQVAMAPLAILQTIILAPFLVVAAIVKQSASGQEDSARRVPEGWYWTEFILDPSREATVRLYYHDDRIRFDRLRVLRVVDIADQPIELPLVAR